MAENPADAPKPEESDPAGDGKDQAAAAAHAADVPRVVV
jgi:hypothetical protein